MPKALDTLPAQALGKSGKITVPESTSIDSSSTNRDRKKLRWRLSGAVRSLIPHTRPGKCYTFLNRRGSDARVGIMKSKSGGCFFCGLQTCSSVWACPVCSSKISERRRADLNNAISASRALGGHVYLLTLTFPHGPFDCLEQLLKRFTDARQNLFNSKTWRQWVVEVGLKGRIFSLEVTRGENGWHVHLHMLLFVMPPTVWISSFRHADVLLSAWQAACVSAGLGKPNDHGLDIRGGDCASSYVSKWGLDCEMTKSHIKAGARGGRTAWDLLADFADTGDCASGDLWIEFVRAFKGKKQLHWSRGLRQYLGLDRELTDKELDNLKEDKAVLMGSFSRYEWSLILAKNARGRVLDIAEIDGWSAVRDFVDFLRLQPT